MGGFYRRRHIWLLAMQTFSPNFESISFVFYLAHGAQERYFHVFVLVATDVSFMKQPFHFRFALTDIFFFFSSSSAASRSLSLSLAVYHFFRSTPVPSVFSLSSRFLSPSPNASAGKIDLIKNEKDYLREMAA